MAKSSMLSVIIVILCIHVCYTTGHNATEQFLEFFPKRLDGIIMESSKDMYISVNFTALEDNVETSNSDFLLLSVYAVNEFIAGISHGSKLLLKLDTQQIIPLVADQNTSLWMVDYTQQLAWNNSAALTVQGYFLGRTTLKFSVLDVSEAVNVQDGLWSISAENAGDEIQQKYQLSVVRPFRIIDMVFIGCITLVVVCAIIGMGCKIDLAVIKEVLRRPFAPIIGFCCQFIIMPLIAFTVAKLLKFEGGLALGFFLCGCAPGGGSSNMFSFLLGGDVSLSVTMTTISLLSSFAMIPLWLFTLGQQFITEDMNVSIPFHNIILSLIGIVCPLLIGVTIQLKRPKLAKKIRRLLKPLFICIIIVMFTLGFCTNLYIFKLFTPILILGACLLPYIGFMLAAIVATICRQPRHRILTIALETGIQNTGIPVMLMKYSLPEPDADLSLVAPVLVAMFTPLPLWILVAGREIYMRCIKKKEAEDVTFTPVNQEENQIVDGDTKELNKEECDNTKENSII